MSYNSLSSHSLSVRDEDEFLITRVRELHDNPVIFLRTARIAPLPLPCLPMYHDSANSWYDLDQMRGRQFPVSTAIANVKYRSLTLKVMSARHARRELNLPATM